MARKHAQVPADGFTIIELIVALTLAALALAIALPTLSGSPWGNSPSPTSAPQSLAADLQGFSLQLQVARDFAVSRGMHYRVRITSQTSFVLEFQSGGWVTERGDNLRPNVNFAAADVSKIAEFDTRGMCVSSSLPVTFTLTDTRRGWSKQVTVNAQGMVDRP